MIFPTVASQRTVNYLPYSDTLFFLMETSIITFFSSTYPLSPTPKITEPHHSNLFKTPSFHKPFTYLHSHIAFPQLKLKPLLSNPSAQTTNEPETEAGIPKFRWVEIAPNNMTQVQKEVIAKLPYRMTKRCKALMRQIICFGPEKGCLADLLSEWVRIMKPGRADWLAVLKHLERLDHPLYVQVLELALLNESFEANVRDYTKLIHLYGKENRLQDAENTLSEMKRRGYVCDQVALTAMVHMYSKAGSFNQAKETFEEIKLLGVPLDKRSYGSMIMAYIRAGMPEEGEALLKEMDEQEIRAGREVYKALLRAYSWSGNCEGAQRVFDAVQFAGIIPDARICGLLINAYGRAGRSEEARMAFENMMKAGIKPSDKCVALVLASFEKEDKINAALGFLLSLERDGIVIGNEASEKLAGWFGRLGVAEEVESVLREYEAETDKDLSPSSSL